MLHIPLQVQWQHVHAVVAVVKQLHTTRREKHPAHRQYDSLTVQQHIHLYLDAARACLAELDASSDLVALPMACVDLC